MQISALIARKRDSSKFQKIEISTSVSRKKREIGSLNSRTTTITSGKLFLFGICTLWNTNFSVILMLWSFQFTGNLYDHIF